MNERMNKQTIFLNRRQMARHAMLCVGCGGGGEASQLLFFVVVKECVLHFKCGDPKVKFLKEKKTKTNNKQSLIFFKVVNFFTSFEPT